MSRSMRPHDYHDTHQENEDTTTDENAASHWRAGRGDDCDRGAYYNE
jgi:hypothetical protein